MKFRYHYQGVSSGIFMPQEEYMEKALGREVVHWMTLESVWEIDRSQV